MTSAVTGTPQPGRVVQRPLAVVADGTGDPTPMRPEDGALCPVDGLLSRVGDPVPVRVGDRSWPAEVLVALVVADAVAAVADESVANLVLVVPDEWQAHRRDVLRTAVAGLTTATVTPVPAALGLVDADNDAELAGPVLAVSADDESFSARLLTRGDDGWRVHRASRSDWGGTDIDDALVEFVVERSPSVRATGADAIAVRAACTHVRENLTRQTATEVELPGGDPVRLVRADLEHLVGGRVADVVDQLVTDVIGPDKDAPSRVLITGSLASLPMVVEAVSGAVGRSVEHVTDPQAVERYAAAGTAIMTSPVAPVPDPDDSEDTLVIPIASLRATQHGRRRRTAVLVAASFAIAAPVAAMTLTGAGEGALLSIVDGIVPQDSAGDASASNIIRGLADAGTLPTLPWSDGDDADDPSDPAAPDGVSAGEDAATDPAPTSTHGDGKDKKKSEKDKDTKDKGTSSDTQGKDGTKDKGKDAKDKERKGTSKGSDKASSHSSSSGNGRAPGTSATSSAHDPATTPDDPSTAPDTPAPTTSTPDPDPTTTTPPADPTTDPTTDPEPDPDPTSEEGPGTPSATTTTGAAATVAAPSTPEQTTSTEPGTL